VDMNIILKLWAKTNQEDDNYRFHPLLCHMLDVAAVAAHVWDHNLAIRLCKRLDCAIGNEARTQIMFLSGAHDIGKASPVFQKRVPELVQYLGLHFSENDQNRPHGYISACVLNQILGHGSVSVLLGQIAGGHHGVFPRSEELFRMGRDTLGNSDWNAVRDSLLHELAKVAAYNLNPETQCKVDITDPLVVPLLAGFISVVDWIGSNQDFFPCAAERDKTYEFSAAEYFKNAQEKARKALYELGWMPGVVFAQEAPFTRVFQGFTANYFQTTAIELSLKQNSPYLMIVEAPTGQGKTEAALYAADLAVCRGFARGMYVAMPTQATGNAMYGRVLDYLKQRGHQGKLNLQLVHGNALLAQTEEVKEGEIPAFEPEDININEQGGDTEAQSWFTSKKRPLLAPFGVGTIDQSLLSVLQTRHWFVRLFGLAGKVIIFDEVHAYDAYMSTILERLLHWLAEMDCTVILLSATLPEAKRKVFVQAYSGHSDAENKRYPRITLAQARHYPNGQADQMPVCEEISVEGIRSIDLHFNQTNLESLTTTLTQNLEHGGCAAVICNTVNRSIEVYKYLRDIMKETECWLFHARTLQKWRRGWEEDVLQKFGKGDRQINGTYANPNRPTRAVLIATQVIEQSLDLDFDLMVSEIAPIDLLLQRSGRLHRHSRSRPKGLEQAKFIVLCNGQREGPPPKTFGKGNEYIYDRYFLLRTWLAMRERDKIQVPNDIERLVEAVYGPDDVTHEVGWSGELEDARKKMEFEQTESEKSATRLLVAEPGDPADLIEQFNNQLTDDEDPEVHKAVRAATREGDPSVTVIMADANTVLSAEPTLTEVRDLLDNSVKLSHRGVYRAVATGFVPKEWGKNVHLRHVRLLRLDEQNQVRVGEFLLTVDEKLGIVIEKEREDNG